MILKQEESETELICEYEEKLKGLVEKDELIKKQQQLIENGEKKRNELEKQNEEQNNEIEKQKQIIQTLSTLGRKMKEDSDKLIKENIALLSDEIQQQKQQISTMTNENNELKSKNEEMIEKVKEVDELKQITIQRNETISKLYEENEKLKKTVENFSQDLQNKIMNETYYVDKRVVNKLLISYITKPQQRIEIVDLMSKIMEFTEQEKEMLGVSKETTHQKKGLFGFFFGKKDEYDQAPKFDMRDKTFGDLWVEFLLRESGGLDPKAPSPQPQQSQK